MTAVEDAAQREEPKGWLRRHAIDVRPLRHSAYRRIFIGNAVSFFGVQFTAVAVPVQVYAITKSALWVGVASFVGLVPLIVFSIWGGAIADAFDRRKVLLVSSTMMWLTTLGLLAQAVLHLDNAWLMLGLIAAQSAAFGINSPVRQAIIPSLVGPEEVASANTLGFTISNAAAIGGPVGAGLVIPAFGFSAAYLVDAIMFTVVLWATLRLPALPPTGEKHSQATQASSVETQSAGRGSAGLRDIGIGLRFLAGHRLILLTFAIDIAAMVLAMPKALFPVVADQRFGESSLGWLYSSIAIGAVLAGLTSGWINRVRRRGIALVGAVVGWGLAVAAAGAVPWLWACVAFMALAGAADMISGVYRQTVLLGAPDEMRGRLQGVFFAVVAGGPRLGDLRAGSVADWTDATFSWVAGGIAAAVVAVLLGAAFPVLLRYTDKTP
ncbi:MFS transporter [Dactylosporangium matsuzakiense]|uniref:MFS transporter n=1 Tax=Dactylosporangium matsuzakiense TaxID=53360 RepID=A0A9W6KIJ9_9ACTN|nr:MFS transporter [Dactylosporangium matsuzakiense]UWZ44477.1 MFS transporter [Dactylosporangium matsuzakiense]GLL01863.1 MFS transporter [Dactylosporangium matsuzakiense]